MPRENTPVVNFVDRFGDQRTIHRDKRGELKLANRTTTIAISLSRAVAPEVGRRIKSWREARGYTLEELCLRAGIASATPKSRMWEIENAIRQTGVKLGTLYAIALALEIPITELLPSTSDIASAANVKMTKPTMPHLTVGPNERVSEVRYHNGWRSGNDA